MSTFSPLGKKPTEDDKKSLIPGKYQDIIYIVAIMASVFIFFWGAISGGGFNSSDNIASRSFMTYLSDAKQTGNFPQWIPYIFGGMPSYSSLLTTGVRWWDFVTTVFLEITKFAGVVFGNDVARVIMFYVFYGIGMYLLMRVKKHERFVSFLTGIAAVFSTYVITWVMIGHNTKPIVFGLFPYVFLLLEKLRVKFSLLYAALLVMAVHLMYEGSHVQMMFYGACAFGIYLIFEFVNRLISKDEPIKVLRSAGLLIIAAGVAFLMSSDRYLATLEYTPHSIRGSAPIKQSVEQHADKPTKDYNYATSWSYNPGETFTFFVPGFFGTKPVDYMGKPTPIYFGAKESEDSPPYMGIGILGLGIIGLILYRKDAFVQAMAGISAFSLIISFGKNSLSSGEWFIVVGMFASMAGLIYYYTKGKMSKAGLGVGAFVFLVYLTGLLGVHSFDMFKLYDVLFWNLPMFYTFRAPSMALALINFAVPILAGYGVSGIIKMRKEATKNEKYLSIAFLSASVGFLVLGFVYSSGFQKTFEGYVNNKLAPMMQGQALPTEILDGLWNGMMSDWYFSAFILILVAGASFLFIKNKLPKTVYFTVLIAATVVDLWRVDYRPMDVAEQKMDEAVFAPYQQFYAQLEADKSLFRVVDLSAPHDNLPAYFRLQSTGGYHPAKLRVYQDLMDLANVPQYAGSTHQLVNPFLWNLMNVKYIIDADRRNPNSTPRIYPNPQVLPRAFFVNNYAVAKPLEILSHLKNGDFNPKDTMFVETALTEQIQPADSNSKADVVSFQNESIKINAQASGNNLLFLSEVYYKPCWKAYVDGKETPIIKANYAFRAVVVPQGSHTVEMKYVSERFETGKNLSLIANIVTILAGAVGLFLNKKKKEGVADTDKA
jgi:hypothetical protein